LFNDIQTSLTIKAATVKVVLVHVES